MSSIASKWPVLLVLPVLPGDVDGDGRLSPEGAERLFAEGRAAYFELVRSFSPGDVRVLEVGAPRQGVAVGPEASISVSVVELFPDRFTMEARVRPAAGEAIAADLSCTVTAGEVTDEVRDDLIAIAHAAAHWH